MFADPVAWTGKKTETELNIATGRPLVAVGPYYGQFGCLLPQLEECLKIIENWLQSAATSFFIIYIK